METPTENYWPSRLGRGLIIHSCKQRFVITEIETKTNTREDAASSGAVTTACNTWSDHLSRQRMTPKLQMKLLTPKANMRSGSEI